MPQKLIPDKVKKQVDEIVKRFNLRVIKNSNNFYITRYRGKYLYLSRSSYGSIDPICRLEYTGSIDNWDFAFWQLVLTTDPPNLEDSISLLSIPVLVMSGDDDRVVPTEQSIRVASAIPSAELVIFDQCGHLPQEECPQAFLEAVTAFLAELP